MASVNVPNCLTLKVARSFQSGAAMKTVSRLMNRDLITTRADARLAPVVEMMMRRGLEQVPVIDHDHALLGVVNRQNLLDAPVSGGDSPEEFLASQQRGPGVSAELDDGFHLDVQPSVTVGEVMRRRVVTATEDMSVKTAAALMSTHHISQLHVVNAVGALIGVLTAGDLVRLLN